ETIPGPSTGRWPAVVAVGRALRGGRSEALARPSDRPLLVRLTGIGSAAEPHAGETAEHRLEGTHQALTPATEHNLELLQQAASLTRAPNLGTAGELEWRQVA
ncbi:MAG: hypothetical protein P8171_14470, partial [Candidatus Thiodiazotropha sp.]